MVFFQSNMLWLTKPNALQISVMWHGPWSEAWFVLANLTAANVMVGEWKLTSSFSLRSVLMATQWP